MINNIVILIIIIILTFINAFLKEFRINNKIIIEKLNEFIYNIEYDPEEPIPPIGPQ